MAVSDFALVSLPDAKAFLGLTDTESARDAFLEAEIERQTARIEAWLDRKVKARFYREDLNANDDGFYTLYPKQTPILAVVNLYSDAEREFNKDALIDADVYEVYGNRIEFPPISRGYDVAVRNRYSPRLRTIRLEYAAGWGVIEIPFTRQRIDLKEETGGERLSFYLDAGMKTPKEIVETLNIELNTAGEHKREVSFDWRTRRFTITQADGELGLLPSVADGFSESESALPLLGFTGNSHTRSPATGEAVALDIPADLKGAVLNLLALDYDKSSHGRHKSRGLRSIRIAEYQASFNTPESMSTVSGMPPDIEVVLDQYKRWTFI